MAFGDVQPLPSCTKPYTFQVAGHSRSNSDNFELLKDQSKPLVYKSLQDDSRGMREVLFYKRIFSNEAPEALKLLRPFLSQFHGIFQCPNTKALYLGLTDLLANFNKPNVCDFKLGTVTYFPDSPAEKKAREESKYIWRRKLGFLLSGMQIYDVNNECFIKVARTFGRNLTPEQIYTVALNTFLGSNQFYRIQLAQIYVDKLTKLLEWYTHYGAKHVIFCRSSVLLMHETCPIELDCDNFEKSLIMNPHVQVYLIDFAHWTEITTFPSINSSANISRSMIPTTTTSSSLSNCFSCTNSQYSSTSSSSSCTFKISSLCNENNCYCELKHGFRLGLSTLIKLMQRVLID